MNERVLNERYALESELGRGGMGVVYRARDKQLDRDVAIKVLPQEYSRDELFMERFRREVLNLAKLSHPNVVQVHDVGEDAGTHYYVMQLVDGTDLRYEFRRRGRFSLEDTLKIISQVADALDYAHEQGIVHRDIKPENILIDSKGTVRVADFGIAKNIGGTKLTGGLIGAPEYMSPEQSKGEEIDGRSDQYSLALVAYEMLTGTTPFRSDTAQPWALVHMHIATPPPDPRQFAFDLPEHAANALLQALEKVPSRRFASCAQFVSALRGETVLTRPQARTAETMIQPSVRRSGSKWLPFTLIPLALILLAGGAYLMLKTGGRQQVTVAICTESSLLARSDCPRTETKTFQAGEEPQRECNLRHPEPETTEDPAPTPPAEEPLSQEEVEALLSDWQSAQNSADFAAYSALYAPDFTGVKRTSGGEIKRLHLKGWLADRKLMFGPSTNLQVAIEDLSVTQDGNEASAEFTQYFRTSRYGDRGQKVMRLRKTGDRVLIVYEEMKWSSKL